MLTVQTLWTIPSSFTLHNPRSCTHKGLMKIRRLSNQDQIKINAYCVHTIFSLNGDQVKISYQCVHFTFHLIKMNFTLYMLEKWMTIICTGTKFNFKQVCKNWLRVKRSSCLPILLFLPSISVGTWTSHCSIESRGLPLYQSFLSPVNQCCDLGKSLFNRK